MNSSKESTKKKPEWLKKPLDYQSMHEMSKMLRSLNLSTVCEGARCPNMGECFRNRTATFLILGDVCTRNCRFCAIPTGKTSTPDPEEPMHLAEAAFKLQLKHVVITSVTRDDLPDGGATQFAACIKAVKERMPKASIEVLIPDFKGNIKALDIVMEANPDIVNHNIETVPELYKDVRPMANYQQSLDVLKYVKQQRPEIYTKSGFMLGLGEELDSVYQIIDDLKNIDCDMLTIGQYLPPSHNHALLKEYIHPDTFKALENYCIEKRFLYTASGPYVRSSYHAFESFGKLKGE
jgi:lipoic acid synthetase